MKQFFWLQTGSFFILIPNYADYCHLTKFIITSTTIKPEILESCKYYLVSDIINNNDSMSTSVIT